MIGSLGNVLSDQFGQVNIRAEDTAASIQGTAISNILGRSLVVSRTLWPEIPINVYAKCMYLHRHRTHARVIQILVPVGGHGL